MSANKKDNIEAWLQNVRQPPWIPDPSIPPVPPVPAVPPLRVPPLMRPFPAFNAENEYRDQLPLQPQPPPNVAKTPEYQRPDRHGDMGRPPDAASSPASPAEAPTKPSVPLPPTPAKWPLRPALKNAQAYRKQWADADKGAAQLPGKALKPCLVAPAFAAKEDTVVRFLLLSARNLDPVDNRDSCCPYVVFKLGNEKYISKVMEDTNDPVWNEPFDIFVPVGNSLYLQIMIMDKDPAASTDFIGRFNLNLVDYQYGATYEVKQDLDDNAGTIKFRMALEKVGSRDFAEVCDIPTRQTLALIRKRISDSYERWSVGGELHDVGEVLVLAYRASTIAPNYSENKLNAICVVELAPKMLWNKGDPKTVNPTWNTMYRMKVTDIHAVLQVTVLTDVKKQEFLGTVAFPLISVDSRKKQWYALKDESYEKTTGGFILLEIDLIYNPVKAIIGCFKDKGPGPPALNDTELTRSALTRNMSRVKAVYQRYKRTKRFVLGCFRWESIPRSVIALTLFTWLTLKGEPYMVPLVAASLFFAGMIVSCCCPFEDDDKDFQEDGQQSEEESSRQSLKGKLVRLQEMAATMQNTMGAVASYGERLHNTMVFADPFVSRMFLVILLGAGFLAYIVPARYWILIIGLRKFGRGFLKRYGGAKESGYDLLHLFNRTPDNLEKARYSTPLPDTDTVPRGTFAAKSTFSLKSLRRLLFS
ncbi:multiple C2 and transmembrane domain-containing protein 1-like isoform X2 [Dermacentor andersoni]|uniref:multiple C2 and transmembrane domain-containing protein 1-like isoform X2 n=1 Tax=Dermacentor andersoni TaxID=34620 RepID=UPI00241783CF|nr:multiple C2 and transmembrane domain-containing protein 1-like isoform X2 [Dermacentor andersoni]